MKLEVLTKTYAPDFEFFADLHASVLRFTDDDVVHRVVVDDADLGLFARFSGPRCQVVGTRSVLPSGFVKIPTKNIMINVKRPWPPVRGWVFQQLIKIAMVGRSDADLVLLLDSDVALVRPVRAADLFTDREPHFFRRPAAVHGGMTRHLVWHQAAMALLGLSGDAIPPLDDYVEPYNLWSPALVRSLCERIESVAGKSWTTAFASHLHVSEFILYGVYIDQVLGPSAPVHPVGHLGCHNYWDEVPLDHDAAMSFVDSAAADDVAVMISAKSGTSLEIRRDALARITGPAAA